MRNALLFGLIALLLACIVFVSNHRMNKPLNILLISIDTLRADHLGAYGYRRKTSPALDRFASTATVFENAYSVIPTTIPSHASLFLGTWPRIHGSTSNHVKVSNRALQFLPSYFRKAGYRTGAAVSARHLGTRFKDFGGFETLDYPDHERSCETTLGFARAWMRQHRKEKYFLWIHLWDPHSPYKLHPEFMPRINRNFDDEFEKKYAFHEPDFYDAATLQKMVDLYDNEIAYMDYHLGKFLSELEPFDNTMIIVVSDHGETLLELQEQYHYAFDHGEFLFDHQTHIPLIIKLPQGASGRISSVVSMIDIMPTVLQAAELSIPDTVSGKSFLPLLYSRSTALRSPFVFLQRRSFEVPPRPYLTDPQFGVRERTYKLLYNGRTREAALYRNDAEDQVVSDLRTSTLLEKELNRWLEMTEKFATKGDKVSPEEAEKLRSLGYVQ